MLSLGRPTLKKKKFFPEDLSISKSNSCQVIKLMDRGQVTRLRGEYCFSNGPDYLETIQLDRLA